jgi:high affinity Mn2+ porin
LSCEKTILGVHILSLCRARGRLWRADDTRWGAAWIRGLSRAAGIAGFGALCTTAAIAQSVATARSDEGWSAWDVGAHVGYGQGEVTRVAEPQNLTGVRAPFGRTDGGLHAGYDYIAGSRLLLGVEGDVSFPYFYEDGAVASPSLVHAIDMSEQIDLISSARARLGYARRGWAIYGTGGLALAETHVTDDAAVSGAAPGRVLRWQGGWVMGAGTEMAITSDWKASVEYLYTRLNASAVTFPGGAGVRSGATLNGLRIGLTRTFPFRRARAMVDRPPSIAPEVARWTVHAQATAVEQGYFRFRSPYEGANSLTGGSQVKNTVSATAFVGLRLWEGGAVYFNPEVDQGFGLNDTHGVAAFPNGEAQKASFPLPRFVPDRLFLEQTFGLGGERASVSDGPNQLAQARDVSRVTLVAGRLAVTDYFDNNRFANDPRTNFLNWNIYGAGAYDWTMDQLSWTWGMLANLNQKTWAVRAGYFLLPTVSSTNSFDMHIPERGEYVAEGEWRYALGEQPGALRAFGWVNHGTMGSYAAALALPATSPGYPDIAMTRTVRTNPGVVLNVQQAITGDIGVFSRASWSPGRDEILGGTDCSQSWSLGSVLQGHLWGRPADAIGLSGAIGGLSSVARAYFAAGGLGILIGDGRLDYRPEAVSEGYYAFALSKWMTLSADYQFVADPGYNADRGPVSIFALRLHTAF